MSYPPQPPAYSAAAVEQVRQQRIQGVKRRYNISLGFQIVFTAIFAALLGYYIYRDRNDSRELRSDGYYYHGNWFKWYIGLLIALLVIDLLSIVFTFRQRKKALDWLNDPNTPPHLIMMGFNPQSDYAEVVIVQQAPVYNQQGGYYQPPPPMYAPPQAGAPPPGAPPPQSGNLYMPPASPPPPASGAAGQRAAGNDRGHLEKPLF
ncbi:hypothetical protein GQ54DRAFT_1534 [Martensiomyces pterosporus]|nr:hypothetical protein GQ54DRAFT_1534 [Martensiomyces pterosporus]